MKYDEIQFTTTKLVVENNDTIRMESFPNHENYIIIKKETNSSNQTKFPWCGKICHIFRISFESKNK